MFAKFSTLVASATLAGTLTLGGMGVASAATTPVPKVPAKTTFNCARAPKVLARIDRFETKFPHRQSVLQADQAKATAAGHPARATRLGRRLTFVNQMEARAVRVKARVTADCPGAVAAPSTSAPSTSAPATSAPSTSAPSFPTPTTSSSTGG